MKIIIGVFLCHVWCGFLVYSHDIFGTNDPYHGLTKSFKSLKNESNDKCINIEEKWFVQPVDHFNLNDHRTWKQRYQINWKHFKPGGPVFLRLEGEGPLDKGWFYNGAWTVYAKQMNAVSIQLEHRYYGKSQPTADLSNNNLIYLTSHQALNDIALFVAGMTESNKKLLSSAKWVVFGGSYAGNLAAWARMKFPHLIHAAVSSSSPLLAKMDFRGFFKSIEKTIGLYNAKCLFKIKQANKMLNLLIQTDQGVNQIKKAFELCDMDLLDRQDKNDVAHLFYSVATSLAGISYNRDNRFYKNVQSTITVKSICDIMLNESSKVDPFSRLVDVYHKAKNHQKGLKCLKLKYQLTIDHLKQTQWNIESAARQWAYQMCNEFGFFTTSDKESEVFSNKFPLDYFVGICADVFGKSYTKEHISNAVESVNTLYGGLNIREERIIYVHGSMDAWSKLGITKTKTKNTIAIFIKGMSNIGNTFASNPSNDPAELTEAHSKITLYLKTWLIENDDFVKTQNLKIVNIK